MIHIYDERQMTGMKSESYISFFMIEISLIQIAQPYKK